MVIELGLSWRFGRAIGLVIRWWIRLSSLDLRLFSAIFITTISAEEYLKASVSELIQPALKNHEQAWKSSFMDHGMIVKVS